MSVPLTNVKTTQSLTLEFFGATADPCFTKGFLESSPNILISGNSFIFNYSHTKVSNDLKFLKLFFDRLNVGATFNFSDGNYVNIETGAQTTWEGQFALRGKTGTYNEYLYFSGVSGTTGLSNGIYDKNLFSSPVQFTANVGATANLLMSKLPDSSPLNFTYLGLYGSDFDFEEYIEVEKSTSNMARIPVKNCIKLNDGSEVIYLDPTYTIVNENLYFQNSFVYAYLRGQLTPEEINFDETINGVLLIANDAPGVYTRVLDNQNQQQYKLRRLQNPPYSVNYYWYPTTTLKQFNPDNIYYYTGIGHMYTKIYHAVYNEEIVSESVASAFFQPPTIVQNEIYDNLYIDNATVTTLIYTAPTDYTKNNFKIDLSDVRNGGTTVAAFADPECTIPLAGNFAIVGTPGREGAAFIYSSTISSLAETVYLQFTRTTTTVLAVVVN